MTDLTARLSEGEGADRALDDAIATHFDYWDQWNGIRNSPLFTHSIDACIALAEKVLPVPDWEIRTSKNPAGFRTIFLVDRVFDATHKSLCRAFLIALIAAKEPRHGG